MAIIMAPSQLGSPARPNFILIIAEDAGRALGVYGDPDARTPNLDRFAGGACRFDQAFSTAPVCAPSRSTIVTGRYSWSIGSHHQRSTLLEPPRLFTQELRDAGYYVNWQNKTDFNFDPPADFADEHRPWVEDLRGGRLPAQPFFLFRNLDVTHESTMWNGHRKTGGFYTEREALRQTLAPELRPDPRRVRVPAYLPDTPAVRGNIAAFYEALALADKQAGEIFDALEASPYRENTIVLYLTDHGRGLVREKRWCYDAGIHLSLVIRAPGLLRPGSVRQDLVSWVDLAPTILSLAGIEPPTGYEGRVFLGPQSSPPREYVYAGRDRMDEAYDRVRAVRDHRWHYLRNYFPEIPYCQRNHYMENSETTQELRVLNVTGKLTAAQRLWMSPTKPAEELYDAINDPEMIRNLAGDPLLADVMARMRDQLDAMTRRTGDKGAIPERKLIAEGLVKDRLDGEYGKLIELLPEAHRVGIERTILEMPGV